MTAPVPSMEKAKPRSLSDLFLSFSWLALQGFGGVLAVAQRELVEKSAGSPKRNSHRSGLWLKSCPVPM